MDAKTVYTVAKALNPSQQIELYKMLKKDVDLIAVNSGKKSYPDFSVADAMIYLIENHFSKIRKF